MNKKQRVILAIFVPVVIFLITLTIANYIGVTRTYHGVRFPPFPSITKNYNPFDWQKTWYVWVISSIFICVFEYKLFEDKKRKRIKDQGGQINENT